MKKNNTTAIVQELADKIAANLDLSIWDVRFLKEGTSWYLRVFIDKPGGVTIDDCEKMSRALDKPLDELDPISTPYCLEVSSPGIERELTKKEHFERYIDKKVMVRLIRPSKTNEKDILGTLKKADDDIIEMMTDDGICYKISKKDAAFVKANDFC